MKRVEKRKKGLMHGINKEALGSTGALNSQTLSSSTSVISYLPSITHFSSLISRKMLVNRFILAFISDREFVLLNFLNENYMHNNDSV